MSSKVHTLEKGVVPSVKLDSYALSLENGFDGEQLRDLFARLGGQAVLIVDVASVARSETCDSEDKPPTVKLRIVQAEAATAEQARVLREAMRSMWRRRQLDGTLDEVGPGPRDPRAYLDEVIDANPTEDDWREHKGLSPRDR